MSHQKGARAEEQRATAANPPKNRYRAAWILGVSAHRPLTDFDVTHGVTGDDEGFAQIFTAVTAIAVGWESPGPVTRLQRVAVRMDQRSRSGLL